VKKAIKSKYEGKKKIKKTVKRDKK